MSVAAVVRDAIDRGLPAEPAPREAAAARLLAAIRDGTVEATTTPEVVLEFAHVRARWRSREDAAGLAEDFADLLSPLLVIDESALRTGLGLFRRHDRLGAFDAVLAAGALAVGATALTSADSAFADVEELRLVVPDARGVASLVGST